jgi:hypothetical protein
MRTWEEKANDLSLPTDKKKKATAAGKAMDNALKVSYSKGGTTKCHFMITNYLKYFDYEKQ